MARAIPVRSFLSDSSFNYLCSPAFKTIQVDPLILHSQFLISRLSSSAYILLGCAIRFLSPACTLAPVFLGSVDQRGRKPFQLEPRPHASLIPHQRCYRRSIGGRSTPREVEAWNCIIRPGRSRPSCWPFAFAVQYGSRLRDADGKRGSGAKHRRATKIPLTNWLQLSQLCSRRKMNFLATTRSTNRKLPQL